MKKRIVALAQHPLISGSSLIFAGSFLANIVNFIFNWYMIGALGVNYSIFAALVSLITLPTLAAGAVVPLVVNFAGTYFAKKEMDKVHGLYTQLGTFYFIFALGLFILFLLFINSIADFLGIHNVFLLVIANLCIFVGFMNILNQSFIQAKLAFKFLTFLLILAAAVKAFFGIGAVNFHFSVEGAFFSVFLSYLFTFLLTFLPLKFIFVRNAKKVKIDLKELYAYGIPSAITTLGLTSFITIDILLVKHFFTTEIASFYAGVSLVARVIFYFTAPIGTVMFPLIVQKTSKGEKYVSTLIIALLLVLIPSLGLTGMYFLFPELMMNIFKINYDVPVYSKEILGLFGMFITLYSINSVLANFYMSIKKMLVSIIVTATALFQAVAIWMNPSSISSIIVISIISNFVLLLSLVIYYPYATKKS